MNFKEELIKMGACQETIEWVGDKSFEEAWNTCHRGDWMLWFYAKKHPTHIAQLTLAAGHCANTVRHLMKDPRSLAAVDAAIAFGEGRISLEELKVVAYAAYAAYAAAYATAAASAASDAASRAASASAAYVTNQLETANICKRYLSV